MKIEVGQIWLRNGQNNYWSVVSREKHNIKIKLIGGDDFDTGGPLVPFYRWGRVCYIQGCYSLVRDCVNCGTARIRYVACSELAYDRRCWSCKGV